MLIALYNEMRSKYGFNEGEMIPEGIEEVRTKIIKLINEGLPKSSKIEAYAFNRPGLHNWCMILYRNKDRNKETHTETGQPSAWVTDILTEAQQKGTLIPRLTIIT